jgi:hypothetical protein
VAKLLRIDKSKINKQKPGVRLQAIKPGFFMKLFSSVQIPTHSSKNISLSKNLKSIDLDSLRFAKYRPASWKKSKKLGH